MVGPPPVYLRFLCLRHRIKKSTDTKCNAHASVRPVIDLIDTVTLPRGSTKHQFFSFLITHHLIMNVAVHIH